MRNLHGFIGISIESKLSFFDHCGACCEAGCSFAGRRRFALCIVFDGQPCVIKNMEFDVIDGIFCTGDAEINALCLARCIGRLQSDFVNIKHDAAFIIFGIYWGRVPVLRLNPARTVIANLFIILFVAGILRCAGIFRSLCFRRCR